MLLLILFKFYKPTYSYYLFTVEINFVVTVILTTITNLVLVATALLSAFAKLQQKKAFYIHCSVHHYNCFKK